MTVVNPEPEPGGLRSRGLQSGLFLTLREGLGMAVRLGGVLALTRLIGPTEYGVYAGVVAFVTVATLLAQMSSEVFLVRQTAELTDERCHEVFSLLLVSTTAVTVAGMLIAALVDVVFAIPVGVVVVLFLSVPLSALWAPAQARLERGFRFGPLAALELAGDFVLYAVALPLAALGWGALAAAVGFVCWQFFLLAGSYALSGYRPRWRWSPPVNAQIMRFGIGLSAAGWLHRALDLVNPLVVGPLAGAATVGTVALAIRLVETLSFVRRVTERLVIAGLSRLQGHTERFASALSEAMGLQTLALGAVLAGFSLVAADVVPLLFGPDWLPVLDVVPWLALAALLGAIGSGLAQGLTVLGRTGIVAIVQLARLIVVAAFAVPLVWLFGGEGYAISAVLAVAPSAALHRSLRRFVALSYRGSVAWVLGFAPVMFAPFLQEPMRYALVATPLLPLASPTARGHVRAVVRTARRRSSSPLLGVDGDDGGGASR